MTRRDAMRCLRRLGFVRTAKSRSGSCYYTHPATGIRVRVSDHEVPSTAERDAGNGWRYGYNVIVWDGMDSDEAREAARELVWIRRDVRSELRLLTTPGALVARAANEDAARRG